MIFTYDSKRVPILDQGMTWPLTGNHLERHLNKKNLVLKAVTHLAAVHPGQADGIVADVDVLLHLADALGHDLAHLEADQLAQRLQLLSQLLSHLITRESESEIEIPEKDNLSNNLSPVRCCDISPHL